MKKGVSPTIGFVLVVTIVLVTALAAYFWSLGEIDRLGEVGRVTTFKNQMIGLDYAIRSVAHGDINFQNSYELNIPDASLVLKSNVDSLVLDFFQNAPVLGKAAENGNETCNSTSDYVYDNFTLISTYRESNTSRVFEGAKGAGKGEAEFIICYYNIDLQFGGKCSEGKGGPRALVMIKKVNYTTKPVVNIDIC